MIVRGNLLQPAIALYKRGWTVIPTRLGAKMPAVSWKRYQTHRPTRKELHRWFAPGGIAGGIAVVLGEASGMLACRDFDEQDAYERWARRFPHLAAELPTVETHRGSHVYFTGPAGFEELEDGEYRADNKHYCLVPPSPHPKGGCYRWVVPLPPGALPMIDDPVSAGLVYHPPTLEVVRPLVNTRDECGEYRGGMGGRVEGIPWRKGISVLTREVVDEVDAAIFDTIPPGPGYRHRQIFELVRRLKAMPRYADAEAVDVLPLLERWHGEAVPMIRTKAYSESERDFIDAWKHVRFPVGKGAIDRAWTKAGTIKLPGSAFLGEPIGQLVRLCWLLQKSAPGKSFFLACRTVGRLAGVSHVAAWKWLRVLERHGVVVRTSTGMKKTKKANEYRFALSKESKR